MVAKSRFARMHKVSHTKPLHDATAQMTDEAVTHRPQTTTIAMDAKPTKHTQALALRKAREIVRFWKGWWSDNPSGSRPNFFGRQHLTFDKGGKCDSVFRGIVRFWEGWTGRKGGGAFERVVGGGMVK